jgi:hypothetical protein
MNSTALKVITISLKVVSILTGLAAYNDLIPAKYAPIAVVVFAVASVAKDSLTKLGDLLDDGQANQSFKG